MRRSIATVSLSGTLEEKLRAAARAGFDGVEIFENDLIGSALAPRDVRDLAESLGLTIDLYQPFRDFEGVDEARLEHNLRRAEAKFALMVELGVDVMLVCSSVAADSAGDDALAAAQLRRLAETAAPYGVRIAYEALAWGRWVDDYRHAWRLVREADHPGLGVCLDSFHILSRGHDPSAIRDIPGERIFFLQLADAPLMPMDVLHWSRHHRCFPGQGAFDLTGFTGHVLAAGYEGPLSLEVFNDVFRAADPERTAADALRSLAVLEDETARARDREVQVGAGETRVAEPGDDRGEPGRAGPGRGEAPASGPAPAALTRLPAPTRAQGYAFVEIAAPEHAVPGVRAALASLGFRHTRDHRSKPVQLWCGGGARVLLNATDPQLGHTWSGDAAVTALGVDVADADAAMRRAERLLAPPLPRRRDPAEADLRAVAAPDGTSIFFCAQDPDERQDWLSDFTVPVAGGDDAARVALGGIDHVGLFQPFDHFDEASLFYRSVLGLEPDDGIELAAPDGMVRSRAMSRDGAAPRIALNASLLGRGPYEDVRGGPQHVAFACDDVFAVARAMRTHGFEPLRIPDNYYADLACRTDLEPLAVERMREYGILYDRVGEGEFRHFYTPMLDGRLFLEVVQRTGGYAGYGSANSPFRMAAQRAEASR
ncbi:bifunctional sugar phosphate isomerase/epimerase/4-hydroxyphenylpyruvate dioxygenase family protein [Nocardiopsis sp. NRRL B-16309]|uniref:bifunctional sugar phosphate isomerase/epimerase/4-hydroxyphenylpyruvate dioxygenase family protein n=1 Tax=Nocardiopsis sp. NRRL B-16309 TaxID=1519494 RepID=UPI0006B03FD7|nr:sugar phosphate isomerase/epimerase and 4-hydroxyphenylpyruvate domain-containing protein [Nocardiopsis sp. NRRL B-16309]KOX09998.1 4-hydroxyphenylpyruvate dioxygenase [Nocardiopsis sp. NRRL B-16309]